MVPSAERTEIPNLQQNNAGGMLCYMTYETDQDYIQFKAAWDAIIYKVVCL